MLGRLNALMQGAAPVVDDFAYRLSQQPRHAIGTADPGMVAQPYADPGYAMPNADIANLNQAPGQEVSGWLPASAQPDVNQGLINQLMHLLYSRAYR